MNPIRGMSNGVRTGSPVLSGLLYSLVCMAAATVLASLVVKFSGVREGSLETSVYIIHSASLFVGGLVAGRRSGRRGWYYGGLMGILYSIVVVLIGFLSYDAALTLYTLILLGLSFVTGALGGMVGVNLRK